MNVPGLVLFVGPQWTPSLSVKKQRGQARLPDCESIMLSQTPKLEYENSTAKTCSQEGGLAPLLFKTKQTANENVRSNHPGNLSRALYFGVGGDGHRAAA